MGLDGNEADHVLGHVMAGTPARCVRAFSSGIRARLTTIHAPSAFSLFLLHVLGRFGASHGVDCDTEEARCYDTQIISFLFLLFNPLYYYCSHMTDNFTSYSFLFTYDSF